MNKPNTTNEKSTVSNAQSISIPRELLEAIKLLMSGCEQAQANGLNQPQINGGMVLARAALKKAGYEF